MLDGIPSGSIEISKLFSLLSKRALKKNQKKRSAVKQKMIFQKKSMFTNTPKLIQI